MKEGNPEKPAEKKEGIDRRGLVGSFLGGAALAAIGSYITFKRKTDSSSASLIDPETPAPSPEAATLADTLHIFVHERANLEKDIREASTTKRPQSRQENTEIVGKLNMRINTLNQSLKNLRLKLSDEETVQEMLEVNSDKEYAELVDIMQYIQTLLPLPKMERILIQAEL